MKINIQLYKLLLCIALTYIILLTPNIYANSSEFVKPFGVAPVTAKFIYNLIDYVTWKEEKEGTVICTVGGDDISSILKKISDSPDFKQKLVIYDHVDNYDKCHILYIGVSKKIESLLRSLRGKPILTVSDISGFAANGGAVGFLYKNDSVSMQVNLKTVNKSNLTIDAELLGLMEIIE